MTPSFEVAGFKCAKSALLGVILHQDYEEFERDTIEKTGVYVPFAKIALPHECKRATIWRSDKGSGKTASDGDHYFIDINRFADDVDRSERYRIDGAFDVGIRSHHNGFCIRSLQLYMLEDIETGDSRHTNIDEGEMDGFLIENPDGIRPVICYFNLVAGILQLPRNGIAYYLFVVNDKYALLAG